MAIILRALCGAVAIGVAIGPAAAAGASDLPDPKVEVSGGTTTMTFSSLTVKQTFTTKEGKVSAPSETPKPGDMFAFSDELRQGGVLIGTDAVKCVQTGKSNLHCAGAFTFAGGSIRAEGEGGMQQMTFPITLTGGTGKYAGISGTGTVVNTDDTHGTVTLHFSTADSSGQVTKTPAGGAATGGGHASAGDSAALLGLGAVLALGGTRLFAARRN